MLLRDMLDAATDAVIEQDKRMNPGLSLDRRTPADITRCATEAAHRVIREREGDRLHDLLGAAKQWRQATESRIRLITNREMSDCLLAPDKALFEAIDKAESKP
jgi:hypothetical protein